MDDESYCEDKVTVVYTALNGQIFTEKAYYHEVQEALMSLNRQAHEAGTSMSYIHIS